MATDLISRAAWHEATFGVKPADALHRASRELDPAEFWTPWELLDSQYAADYVAWYIRRSITTGQ